MERDRDTVRDRDPVNRRPARDEPRRDTVVTEEARHETRGATATRGMDVETAAAGAIARDPLSWGPIWAGVLTAFGLFLIMSLIGLAAGLQTVELGAAPGNGEEAVSPDMIALIVTGIFLVVAFFAGGFVSSWSAGLVDEGRGILHGFLVWALFIVLLLLFAGLGIGQVFGAAGAIFGGQFSPGAVDIDVNQQQLLEAFQDAAWQTLFAVVLALAAAVLGGLVGTREEFSRKWDDYTTRVRR
jgi:hypothetical protein